MRKKGVLPISNISISGFIDKGLGEFAEALQKDATFQARECLKRRFSNPEDVTDHVDVDSNRYFIYIIKQKGWKVQKQMIPGTPIAFFIQEDILNDTMLHMIAKQDVAKMPVELRHYLKKILEDYNVKKKIITRLEERKDFPTPLEIAIRNLNYDFIGEFFKSLYAYIFFNSGVIQCQCSQNIILF